MTWERVNAGRYRCGRWEIVRPKARRWEVWWCCPEGKIRGDTLIHSFPTLAEAKECARNETDA